MSDYNGWSNWDTWNTNLYLNNDEGSYFAARAICRKDHRPSCEKDLEALAREIVPTSEGIDFNDVDWQEIIKGFNED
jgi:hypothetical protein